MGVITKSPLGLVTRLGNGSPQTGAVMWLPSSLSAASCSVPLCELVVVLGVVAYGVLLLLVKEGDTLLESEGADWQSVRIQARLPCLIDFLVISYYYSLDRLTWLDAFIHRRKKKSKKEPCLFAHTVTKEAMKKRKRKKGMSTHPLGMHIILSCRVMGLFLCSVPRLHTVCVMAPAWVV